MIRISNIKIPVGAEKNALYKKISGIIKTKEFDVVRIVKCSLDARKKDELLYIYTVDINTVSEELILRKQKNNNNIMLTETETYKFPYKKTGTYKFNPVIIGAGPAGYFCGLYLARAGYEPLIIERGKDVFERTKDVDGFWKGDKINPESNVSFGEGGAGTFSDGKLNTGIKDKQGRIEAFIDDFLKFGAPEDISYTNKPHVGTNELKNVLYNMRQEIIGLGGKIYFNSRFVGYEKTNNLFKISVERDGKTHIYETSALILAIGHSARDTFRKLHDLGLHMEAKSFAMGLRIEHPRTMIDEAQYGNSDAAKMLPAADYKMTYRSKEGRSVYSFCMCPGGFVVNASSGENQSVVNGMSNHARDEENSNSAIVVNVTPEDFYNDGCKDDVLAGIKFQEKYEKLAYEEGKGGIPVQLFKDYADGVVTKNLGGIKPNIKGTYTLGNLNNCLPEYVNNAIIEGISYYDTKLKGFAREDAVLSGIESRTSSPVRIIRDDNLMSDIKGIFPCGEGAGYAGGITSAAVDGIKVAEAVAAYINSL